MRILINETDYANMEPEAMDEKPESITFAMNPPEASEPTLTGVANEIPLSPENSQGQQNYVISQNGVFIVPEKPPFNWKEFYIGAGIPVIIMIIPILLMATYGDPINYMSLEKTIALVDDGDGTAYIGTIDFDMDDELLWCQVSDGENAARCDYGDGYNHSIEDYHNGQTETLGYANFENGMVYFDYGGTSNKTNVFTYGYQTAEQIAAAERASFIEELFFTVCWISPIAAVIVSIIGFSSGKKSLGYGGLTGLALYPGISFAALVGFFF